MGKFLAPRIATADRTGLTLDVSELVFDTDTETYWFGDGATVGGIELAAADQVLPSGGTAGQVLEKIDSSDYNTQWATPSGGGGSSNADYNNIFLLGI